MPAVGLDRGVAHAVHVARAAGGHTAASSAPPLCARSSCLAARARARARSRAPPFAVVRREADARCRPWRRSRAATTTQTDLEATGRSLGRWDAAHRASLVGVGPRELLTASARAGVAATLGYKAYAPNTEPLEVRASAPVKAPSRAPRAATPSDTAAHSAGRGREVLLLPPAGPEDGLIGEGTDSCGAQAKSAQNIPCRSAEGEVHASDGGTVGPETTKAQDKDAVFSPPPRSTANSQRASHESLHPETTKAQLKELVLSPPPRNSVNSQRASRNSFNSQRASHDSFAVDAADPVGWLLRIIGTAIAHAHLMCCLASIYNKCRCAKKADECAACLPVYLRRRHWRSELGMHLAG